MDNETAPTIRPTDLAEMLGCSIPYASQLLSGARDPKSLELALSIFDKTGVKLGKLKGASESDIDALRRLAA